MPFALEDARTTVWCGLGGTGIGGWYGGVFAGDVLNIAVAHRTLYAVPFPTGENSVVAARMFVVHGNVNSSSLKLGIYNARSDSYPRSLLFESATLVYTTTDGLKMVVCSLPLDPNRLYYTVFLASSADSFTHGISAAGQPATFGYCPDMSTTHYCITASWAFGALPATFPGSGVPATSGPAFGVSLVSSL